MLALAAAALLAVRAHAHDGGSSRSTWRLEPGGAQLSVSVSVHDLGSLGDAYVSDGALAADYLTAQLTAHTDLGSCSVAAGSLRPGPAPAQPSGADGDASQALRVWQWRVTCPAASSLRIESQLFARTSPRHLHVVQLVAADGKTSEHTLTDGRRSLDVRAAAPPPSDGFGAWLSLGIEHVLTGYDHLAFILALLVGAASLGALAWTLTGFTLGHALTLTLAALGMLSANTQLVEALIGASIVVVALGNLRARRSRAGTPPTRLRTLVAAGFGLIHGLGFASALAEHGLPREGLVTAVVGFNLGVECGQLFAAALVWMALRQIETRRPALHTATLQIANAVVCVAGLYWTVTRAM